MGMGVGVGVVWGVTGSGAQDFGFKMRGSGAGRAEMHTGEGR